MHRVVYARKRKRRMGEGRVVNHDNGDPFDNRRDNLVLSSRRVNMRNKTSPKTTVAILQNNLEFDA